MADCRVIGCTDGATHRAVLQAKFPEGSMPYGAKVCNDHASTGDGRSYRVISSEPLNAE